ncbi:hypothetical protein [Bacillus dakarensis]|uniref:hypothetical protein n=1 Tax=Robertmurraya dakarensis TaxID=1926278 RepID=UPI000981BFB1|nr:hypothetical protein [Bacillus dakarensis]
MKRKRKSFLKRTAACSLALFIVIINFLPVAALASNFNPGTFSPGTFSPGEFNTGTFTPGTFDPGTFDPGDFDPGTFSPGQYTPGQFTPGQFTPGEFSPGETSPGTTNPGNFTPEHPDGPGGNPGGSNGDPNSPSISNPSNTEGPDNGELPTGQDGSSDPGTSNSGGSSDKNGPPLFPYEDNQGYKDFKFITNSMVFPAIEGLDRHTLIDIDWNRYGENYTGSFFKGVIKGQLETGFKNDSILSAPGNLALDIWSGVDHAKHLSKFVGSWSDIKSAWTAARSGSTFSTAASGAGTFFSGATKSFNMGTGIAGKAAPWMAAISTGVSGAETVMNFANGKVNDGIASLGETLMSGAVVLSATGVGAPVAAGVAVVGGALWLGAKIYKNAGAIASAWKNRKKLWNDAKENVGNAVKAVKNKVSEGVDAVKSGFKKVVGWFS